MIRPETSADVDDAVACCASAGEERGDAGEVAGCYIGGEAGEYALLEIKEYESSFGHYDLFVLM